jgi:hypothetical protein
MLGNAKGGGSEPLETRSDRGPMDVVVRESVEIMRAERDYNYLDSDTKRYNALRLILNREIAVAITIPDPDPNGTEETTISHSEWAADRLRLKKIIEEIRQAEPPVPRAPKVFPRAADFPKVFYDVKFIDSIESTFLREELVQGLHFMMTAEREIACARSLSKLIPLHLEVRTLLGKYRVWSFRSAFSTRSEVYGNDEADAELDRSQELARMSTPAALPSGSPSPNSDDDADGDDEDYGDTEYQ